MYLAKSGDLLWKAAADVPATVVNWGGQEQVSLEEWCEELARLTGAELVILDGRCGHQAPQCERSRVLAAVQRFLEPKPGTSSAVGTPH